ncbi:MAG: hypothetical protein HY564_01635 [Candidatus Jacksonbacteria bacterium]|nr:hypothetical protein [Candidatus Jacksonbacteria bacterium]
MRRSEFFYTLILPPLDYAMLILSGLLAYHLRGSEFINRFDLVSPVFYQLPLQRYILFISAMAVVWVIFFALAGLYNPRSNKIFVNQISKIILACIAGMVGVVMFLFFKREFLFASRFMILAGSSLAIALTILARGIVRGARRMLLSLGVGAMSVAVIGGDANTKHFVETVSKNRGWGYRVLERVLTHAQLEQKLVDNQIEEVILADLNFSKEKVNDFLDL